MGSNPRAELSGSAPSGGAGRVYRDADVPALVARAELADIETWSHIATAFDSCAQHRLRAPSGLVRHALRVLLRLHEHGRVIDASRLSSSFASWLAADPANEPRGVSRLRWQVATELAAIAPLVPLPVRAALPRGWRLGAPLEAKKAIRAYFAGRPIEELVAVRRILRRHAPTIHAALGGAMPMLAGERPQVSGVGLVMVGILALCSFGLYLRAAHEPRAAAAFELSRHLEPPLAPFRVDLVGAPSARPSSDSDRMSQVLSADADAEALGRLAADLGEQRVIAPTRAVRKALLADDCVAARAASVALLDATERRTHRELGALALPIEALSSAVRRLCPR